MAKADEETLNGVGETISLLDGVNQNLVGDILQ